MEEMEITSQDLFVVVDVQNDFCPFGMLAVAGGDQVIDVIHRAATKFPNLVLTQDWHPPGHSSFASAHPGRKPLEIVEAPSGLQTLWPDHCVQGTRGAEFHPSLSLPQAQLILRKGYRMDVDSYSAFFENDHVTPTGLAGYMIDRGLRRVFFAGLAYDFCVGFSALDAIQLGFGAVILVDGSRAIDVNGSVASIEEKLRSAGALIIESNTLIRA